MKTILKIVLILTLNGIAFANISSDNFDLNHYKTLYQQGQYQDVVNDLSVYFISNKDWKGEPEYIEVRNLLSDSYRMLSKYTQASLLYANTIDGYFDSYADYCFYVFKKVGVVVKFSPVPKKVVEPKQHYNGEYGPNPKHEEILKEILEKLSDNTPLSEKRQYFHELIDKNNDWVTNLSRFCAGEMSLNKLMSSVPKEAIGTVSTYVGLYFQISGNQTKANNLYQKALAVRDSSNIELLLAANKIGLFSLKIIYTTFGFPGREVVILTDVYSIKASSAKSENNRVYSIQNLIDGDSSTTWVPDKNGIGEWTEVSFDDSRQVNSLTIVNGYAKSDVAFKNNNRIKTATLEFSDGSQQTITLKDTMQPQTIQLGKSTQKIRFTINEVYKGAKYDDTCLSGLDVNFEAP